MKRSGWLIWPLGLAVSFLFIWGVAALFHNSVSPQQWDDGLQKFVEQPGSILRFRSEGWADTEYGRHGMTRAGERVFYSADRKFIFWGDSFADSTQVAESERAMAVFNRGRKDLKGVAVAGGGLAVADYYFDIPRYERLAPGVAGHVVLLAGLQDVTPGEHVECHSRFLSAPWRFEASSCEPSTVALRFASTVNRYRLDFLHGVYRAVVGHDFRFSPGEARAMAGPESDAGRDMVSLEGAWTFLARALREQTDGFIIFVYAPYMPTIVNGEVVLRDDKREAKDSFRRICEDNGIGFIDLSDAFASLYVREGVLPTGFFNTPPGSGHLNRRGQRLIADALEQYMDEAGI